jgi:hypothetical protein
VTTIAIPEPDPSREKALLATGLILWLAETAGYRIVKCRKVDNTFWDLIELLSDPLIGAYMCLKREKLSLVDNIPKNLQDGWGFALWYAFMRRSKENDKADYMKIRRVTGILASSGAAWTRGSVNAQLQRLYALIRAAAYKKAIALDTPKSFLKKQEYFLEKFVGKKPIAGLYTEDEFALVTKNWESRQQQVRDLYKGIPDDWKAIEDNPGGLAAILAKLNIKQSQNISVIESAKQKRIPSLLVKARRGRNQNNEIVKGNSLPEKLMNIEGGESIRTVGKVLWSPCTGITQTVFVDTALRIVRDNLHDGKFPTIEDLVTHLEQVAPEERNTAALRRAMPDLGVAIATYLEILPDKRGNPSWDSYFGVS